MVRRGGETAPQTGMIDRDIIEKLLQRRAEAEAAVTPVPRYAPTPQTPVPEHRMPAPQQSGEKSRIVGGISIDVTETEAINILNNRRDTPQVPVARPTPAAQPESFRATPPQSAPFRDLSDFDYLHHPVAPTEVYVDDAPLAGLARVPAGVTSEAYPAAVLQSVPTPMPEVQKAPSRPDPIHELLGDLDNRDERPAPQPRVNDDNDKPEKKHHLFRVTPRKVMVGLSLYALMGGLTAHTYIDDAVKENSTPWGAAFETVASLKNLNPMPGVGLVIKDAAEYVARKEANK